MIQYIIYIYIYIYIYMCVCVCVCVCVCEFWCLCIYVTYRPLTQPSIKKHVYPVEDIRVSPWGVEFGAIATPTGSRWKSNNYITRCQSWNQLVGVRVAVREVKTSFQQRTWALRTPSWAAWQNEKDVLL